MFRYKRGHYLLQICPTRIFQHTSCSSQLLESGNGGCLVDYICNDTKSAIMTWASKRTSAIEEAFDTSGTSDGSDLGFVITISSNRVERELC
jgi:hypothetical protein